jgi:hypothetical protein
MRQVGRVHTHARHAGWLEVGAVAVAALAPACAREVGPTGPAPLVPDSTPLCDASDPGQVVAPQRIQLITSTELMNMIGLVSPAAAEMVVTQALFPVLSDITVRFPPPRAEQYRSIPDADTLLPFSVTAQAVGNYVRDNFASVTKCSSPATDACATGYLDALAVRAYRRQLTADEQARFSALYTTLRDQLANGYEVTLSVEEATGNAVYALLMTPQLLWRWELGGAQVSTSPPGVTLTDDELASSLSFFLTDRPPDDLMLADTKAGTFRANLAGHIDRLLATQTSRAWLRHIMEIYFFLNQLPSVLIDSGKFPIVAGGGIYGDLQTESRLFLDDVMWNGKVTDLLTSRRTFLNSNLATQIYDVPVPAGATATSFVETTLPSDTRSGLLTNAGFITTRARSTGPSVISRGIAVKSLFTCLDTGPEDPADFAMINQAALNTSLQTAQQQVAFRAQYPKQCGNCHATFDPYGLVLDWYDVVGRYRTVDDLGQPVDGHTTLPAVVGGETVDTAVETAAIMARSDAFTNCMARSMLQYALIDAIVELPVPAEHTKGCATAGIAHILRKSSGQSFTDLFRAIATSSAFLLRQPAP